MSPRPSTVADPQLDTSLFRFARSRRELAQGSDRRGRGAYRSQVGIRMPTRPLEPYAAGCDLVWAYLCHGGLIVHATTGFLSDNGSRWGTFSWPRDESGASNDEVEAREREFKTDAEVFSEEELRPTGKYYEEQSPIHSTWPSGDGWGSGG